MDWAVRRPVILDDAAERGDLWGGHVKDEGPEIRGAGAQAKIGTKHVADLLPCKNTEQPSHIVLVPMLEHALDRVNRVRRGVEILEVRIPEQRL